MTAPLPPPKKQTPKGRAAWLMVWAFPLVFIVCLCSSCSTNSRGPTAPSVATSSLSPEQIQQRQQQIDQERRLRLDPKTYNAISPHDYALMLKDPAAHKGQKIIVFGVVTQFDTGTGQSEFRADTAAEPQDGRYGYQQNTMIDAIDPSILANVVKDDYVQMYVEVAGTESYKTTTGGDLTVPKFWVYIINVTYSPHQ
jgi:hypothetical protein